QLRTAGPPGTRTELEAEARDSAMHLVAGRPTRITRSAVSELSLNSTLSDDLETVWKATHEKARIFDRLREPSALGDADARACLRRLFPAGSDDLWLSETLLDNGPEPLWPPALIKDRVARAAAGKWAAEPGDINADLADPYAA